ncbi:Hypothetical predicted protein [Octopus vulgaris]|uniref:Uncharacterized protein n=1 Tax=Octopus vulgaris TaxID=6645 RepID=A0AA36AIQ9_OCTVU|nr:Hypothetical predicted protein [Octopus vulgaris]
MFWFHHIPSQSNCGHLCDFSCFRPQLSSSSLSFNICFPCWYGLYDLTGAGKPKDCTRFHCSFWHSSCNWVPFLMPTTRQNTFYVAPAPVLLYTALLPSF